MRKRERLTACICGLFLWVGLQGSAGATTVLQVTGGILTGATGVDVSGRLYDVQFVDGSCDTLFNSCSSFTFSTLAAANTASNVLLTSVFFDGVEGLFDTHPELTHGCTKKTCLTFTPFESSIFTELLEVSIAENNRSINFDEITNGSTSTKFNPVDRDDVTFAVWSAARPVPLPPTILSLGAAGIGLLLGRRRKRTQ